MESGPERIFLLANESREMQDDEENEGEVKSNIASPIMKEI